MNTNEKSSNTKESVRYAKICKMRIRIQLYTTRNKFRSNPRFLVRRNKKKKKKHASALNSQRNIFGPTERFIAVRFRILRIRYTHAVHRYASWLRRRDLRVSESAVTRPNDGSPTIRSVGAHNITCSRRRKNCDVFRSRFPTPNPRSV